MIASAIILVVSVLAFAGGAWLMFTALRPQPGLETYCIKCGHNLTDGAPRKFDDLSICPKCRRLLGPEMMVTCTRSALAPGRLVVGLLVVIAAAVAVIRVLGAGVPSV